MRLLLSTLLLTLTALCGVASTKDVTGEYIYVVPENISLEQGHAIALERAKMQIIADEFGTTISQSNYTNITNSNGNSSIDFQSISMSDLRGEWLQTYGEPEYNVSLDGRQMVIRVRVKGKIRKIEEARVQFSAKLLRNFAKPEAQASELSDGDNLFFHFKTPVDGYLALYLIDGTGVANCLLPYARQREGIFKVNANQEYILFDPSKTTLKQPDLVDEYCMSCDGKPEACKLVVLFSQNQFVKALDNFASDSDPRQLSGKDFNKWVASSRASDRKLQMLEIPFTINPK